MLKSNTKKKTVLLLSLLIGTSLLFACQPDKTREIPNLNIVSENNTKISGKVIFEDSEGFSTKATFDQVAGSATVSLIYSHNHASKPNQTIATGLTDEFGNFTINSYFTPSTGEIFVLEAVKRIGGTIGKKVLSLRTYVRWNGSDWESITFPNKHIISPKTTALAILAGKNVSLSLSSLINSLDVTNVDVTKEPAIFKGLYDINNNILVTGQNLTDLTKLVENSLTAENDPVEAAFCTTTSLCNIVATSKISFVSNMDGNNEIYLMNIDGTNQSKLTTRLTKNTADDQTPVLSPDGKKIAFVSNVDGNNEIYVMDNIDLDGNNIGDKLTRLTKNSAVDATPVWSPDSKKLAFVSGKDGNNEIYITDITDTDNDGNGDNITRLTNNTFNDNSPVISPDGNKIAYVTNSEGKDDVFVMTIGGNSKTNLTKSLFSSKTPSWSPDSKKLAFIGTDDILAIGLYTTDATDSDSNGDGDNLTNFFANDFEKQRPVWSKDGTKIAYTEETIIGNSKYQVWTVGSDKTDKKTISNNLFNDQHPVWSPDGSKIIFTSDRDGSPNNEVYIMNTDGTNQTNLTKNSFNDFYPDTK